MEPKTFEEFCKEQLYTENVDKTLTLWHGGNLKESLDETFLYRKGRFEYGPGLYLTTHYGTAVKYAKGGRKLYKITVAQGNDASDVNLPFNEAVNYVRTYAVKSRSKRALETLEKYKSNLTADILINVAINDELFRPSDLNDFRIFLVHRGVDYNVVDNAFGWHERMIVLYNFAKIVSKVQITPKDKLNEFDLDINWK